MSRTDLVSYLLQIKRGCLSKKEKMLLEIKLFTLLYRELYEIFHYPYQKFAKLIPVKHYQEDDKMLGVNFTQEMIKDILSTNEYSLSGIAIYTNMPEEVLFDVAAGVNAHPTFELSRRIFELHIAVRRDLYNKIFKKISSSIKESLDNEGDKIKELL